MEMQRKRGSGNQTGGEKTKAPVPRLRPAERRAQILARATDYFAEYGLSAQTRAIADACGVAQRLLYRYFPSKAALMAAVYDDAILSPFKAVWLAQLKDRSLPMNERLVHFYSDYFSVVLTRKWLRLFMHASLSEVGMAPDYINAIIKQMLLVIAEETAAEQKVQLPDDADHVLEIGWILHGAVSHFAIRRHLYKASQTLPDHEVTLLHIRSFLSGFAAACEAARDVGASSERREIFSPVS